jgi:Flp pilus assembly protein TadG
MRSRTFEGRPVLITRGEDRMTTDRPNRAREKGIALVYVGVFLVPLLLCTGLAVDMGRGYLVRVALAKAVDAAALAAARSLNGDRSQAEAVADNIFAANFPAGFLGVISPQDPPTVTFTVDDTDGSNIVRVDANRTLPTTFMRMAKFDNLTVAAAATATRRLVDMSFVIDRSGSLQGEFAEVQDAAKEFVDSFDKTSDRIALIGFSSGTSTTDHMSTGRGFDPGMLNDHIDAMRPAGPTATAEALYQAWGELRSVPSTSQSGLRIVVLFTDGSPNAFPGNFDQVATSGVTCDSTFPSSNQAVRNQAALAGTICAIDYPKVGNFLFTSRAPWTIGLYQTHDPNVTLLLPSDVVARMNNQYTGESTRNGCIPYLPRTSSHQPTSIGMPSSFFIGKVLPNELNMAGAETADGFPNTPRNAYVAARNLAKTVADAIRSDTSGSSRIRIYTLGLGDLLEVPMGSVGEQETGSHILRGIANEKGSDDYNSDQLDGRYYFAGDPDQLKASFQSLKDQIVRLTQ